MARSTPAEDWLLIGSFLVMLALPLVDRVWHLDRTQPPREKRQLAAFPTWPRDRAEVAAFPRRIESYYDDHFGFRNRLIRWHNLVKVEGLGVSSSASVVIGKEGWLYLATDGELESYRADQPFTERELEQWCVTLQRATDWLRARRAQLLFMIAPDKSTIYPEHLPDWVKRVGSETRLDQLVAHLRIHSTVEMFDPRSVLLEAKQQDVVYFRTDTHWNDRGARIVTRALLERLARWIPVLPDHASAFEMRPRLAYGELANMLGLPDRMREPDLELIRTSEARAQAVPFRPDLGVASYHRMIVPLAFEREVAGDQTPATVVVVRDSFFVAMMPLFSERFHRTVYLPVFKADVIEAEHPQVVVWELVERDLAKPPPLPVTPAPSGAAGDAPGVPVGARH